MKKILPPIVYAKQDIGGVLARPDSRYVLEKAVLGHPIEVHSGNAYINLYHVFRRMLAGDRKRYRSLRIVRTQFAPSRWRIHVVGPGEKTPTVDLDEGYDPKRGRYKRYADRLVGGEMLILRSKAEAVKARRAWHLYVPREKRRRLRSTVRQVGKSKRFVVAITVRRAARPSRRTRGGVASPLG